MVIGKLGASKHKFSSSRNDEDNNRSKREVTDSINKGGFIDIGDDFEEDKEVKSIPLIKISKALNYESRKSMESGSGPARPNIETKNGKTTNTGTGTGEDTPGEIEEGGCSPIDIIEEDRDEEIPKSKKKIFELSK